MATPDDARRALLTRLIDQAPLFPPTSLSLPEAIAGDERAHASPHGWTLARFVCPASRLCELPHPGRGFSAVLDEPIPLAVEVQAAEARYRDDLDPLRGRAAEVYVEVPLDDELDERLDAIDPSSLAERLVPIGSWSFVEPVEELESLGVLSA